jgi:hypothetical protein
VRPGDDEQSAADRELEEELRKALKEEADAVQVKEAGQAKKIRDKIAERKKGKK